MSRGKYYLAGPMTGIPMFNYPTFDAATTLLRAAEYEIINPTELDPPDEREASMASNGEENTSLKSWGWHLSRDVAIIADDPKLKGVIVLPSWETSKGARLEVFVALTRDKEVLAYDPLVLAKGLLMPLTPKQLLKEIYTAMVPSDPQTMFSD